MKIKNTIIILVILIIIVIVSSVLNKKNIENTEVAVDPVTVSTSTADTVTDIKSGVYELYSPEKIIKAENGDVVLFFKADWCPSCKTVDADIVSNLKLIPENLTILDVDYDTYVDLKKKYGVTYQHTFVQVDKDGNTIKKWSGGSTLASILKEII